VEVFVGSGNSGAIDGNGLFTSFDSPSLVVADASDNIYVWDSGNRLIRRINQNRDVVTIAGGASGGGELDGVGRNTSFNFIYSMVADNSGNIYFACGTSIRKMDAMTNVVTIAGSFTQSGYTNGAGDLARFGFASGVCLSQGMMFVADPLRVRNITFNPSSQPVLPANLQLSTYPGLHITGTVGRTYQIQTSPDLTNWTTTATLLLTANPYLWIDQSPTWGSRFYRAFLLP
jgi:hypothetical protein